MEMTYVALKPLKIGDEIRQPGELVPEAKDWRRADAWVGRGFLSVVPESDVENRSRRRSDDSDAEDPVGTENAERGFLDPTLTVPEVKTLVEEGHIDSQVALGEEMKRAKPRTTLVKWLEERSYERTVDAEEAAEEADTVVVTTDEEEEALAKGEATEDMGATEEEAEEEDEELEPLLADEEE